MRKKSDWTPSGALSRCAVFAVLLATVCGGCTPRVVVRKSPPDHDRGIRYYRPKPYLKIEPAEVQIDKNQTSLVPGLVRISLVYMPDFSEEYSINVRSGCGTANVGVKLQDGWNLTEISQDLDSQTDENIKAMGSLLSAAGGLIPTAAGDRSADNISFTVPARNVPLGFYESVVGRDPCNVKRLYGFRYLGFMPFAGCPLEMNGYAHASCEDPAACGQHPAGSLYGLTFVAGEMVFQPLDVMAVTPAVSATRPLGEPASATTAPAADSKQDEQDGGTTLPSPRPGQRDVDLLATELRAYLDDIGLSVDSLATESTQGRTIIRMVVPIDKPTLLIRTTVDDWLRERFTDTDWIDVQIQSSQP